MAKEDGRVVSNFILQALENKPITIYGNGKQTRSFCYVDDLIDGIHRMMDKKDFQGPVNLGNPCELTIKQLAELILKLTGSKSKIEYLPATKDDPQKRKPDISLAEKTLKWKPKIDIEAGFRGG